MGPVKAQDILARLHCKAGLLSWPLGLDTFKMFTESIFTRFECETCGKGNLRKWLYMISDILKTLLTFFMNINIIIKLYKNVKFVYHPFPASS